MKKAILKLEVRDDEQKKEVMDTVSGFSGVDSFSMDMKEKELTVIGDFDPVNIVSKLMKLCHTEVVSVVPVNEAEKKKEDGQKKGYPEVVQKKDDGKMKGYDGAKLFAVDTSFNPLLLNEEFTKPPPLFAVDTSFNPLLLNEEFTKPPPPKKKDEPEKDEPKKEAEKKKKDMIETIPYGFKVDTSYKPIRPVPIYNPRLYNHRSPPKTADDDTSSASACVIL